MNGDPVVPITSIMLNSTVFLEIITYGLYSQWYKLQVIGLSMWTVLFSQRFDDWLNEQEDALQEKVLADLKNLQVYGPELPRPYADTVKGSRYKNMKELRVQFSGRPIRAFYAFDPIRRAIVLCAGDKSNDKRFYKKLVRIAEDEFAAHLNTLESK